MLRNLKLWAYKIFCNIKQTNVNKMLFICEAYTYGDNKY